MNLQPAPIWQDLLFHSPLPLVVVLLAVAGVLRVLASRRRNPKFNYGAMTAVLVAVGVFLLAHFVETDHERLAARTRQLIQATAPLDAAALDELLAQGVVLTGPGGQAWLREDQIRGELERTIQRFPIKEQAIRSLGAEVTSANRGLTLVALATTMQESLYGAPIRSLWLLHWRRDADGPWRVAEIQWLEFQHQPPSEGLWR